MFKHKHERTLYLTPELIQNKGYGFQRARASRAHRRVRKDQSFRARAPSERTLSHSNSARVILTWFRQVCVEIAGIYVGPAREQFRVQKHALCMIEYFNNMSNSGFTEVSSKFATFPVDDPKPFDVLIDWIYHGTLGEVTTSKVGKDTKLIISSWSFVEVYSLAEKLCMPHFQNVVMSSALVLYEIFILLA